MKMINECYHWTECPVTSNIIFISNWVSVVFNAAVNVVIVYGFMNIMNICS